VGRSDIGQPISPPAHPFHIEILSTQYVHAPNEETKQVSL
jgi:hypothetical protein